MPLSGNGCDASQRFDNLLKSLAAEHEREVKVLRAEIAKLQKQKESRPPPFTVYKQASPPEWEPNDEPLQVGGWSAMYAKEELGRAPEQVTSPQRTDHFASLGGRRGMPRNAQQPGGPVAAPAAQKPHGDEEEYYAHAASDKLAGVVIGAPLQSPRMSLPGGRSPREQAAFPRWSPRSPQCYMSQPETPRPEANLPQKPDATVVHKQDASACDTDVPSSYNKTLTFQKADPDESTHSQDEQDSRRKDDNVDSNSEEQSAQVSSTDDAVENWRLLLGAVDARVGKCTYALVTAVETWHTVLRDDKNPTMSDNAELATMLRFLNTGLLQQQEKNEAEKTGIRNTVRKFCSRRHTVHPDSLTRMMWDLSGSVILMHDLLMIPTFVFNIAREYPSYTRFTFFFDYFSAGFWTFDIMISFMTGYYSSHGFIEMDPWKAATHYLRSWFPLDCFIVITDWVSMVLELEGASNALRLGKTASRFMRIFRLLRLLKLNTRMKELLSLINSEYLQAMIGLLQIVCCIVLLNHYLACVWWGISLLDDDWNWTSVTFDDERERVPVLYAYLTCMHWSVTQLTGASVDVNPVNIAERAYTIVITIMALVVLSSFISSITSTMTRMSNFNRSKTEQEIAIRGFFTEHKIPKNLVSRVWHNIHYQGKAVRKRTRLQDIEAFDLLHESVRDELQQAICIPTLVVHPLFQAYQKLAPDAMGQICKTALEERTVSARREVYADHTHIKAMVFVARGSLDYTAAPEGSARYVRDGQWACEAALWVAEVGLEGPLISVDGGCELIMLNAEAFQRIALITPFGSNLLAFYAELFVTAFNNAQRDDKYNNVLFNDLSFVEDIVQQALVRGFPGSQSKRWKDNRTSISSNRSSTTATRDTVTHMALVC